MVTGKIGVEKTTKKIKMNLKTTQNYKSLLKGLETNDNKTVSCGRNDGEGRNRKLGMTYCLQNGSSLVPILARGVSRRR
jgi:hypothetical protein